MKNIKKTREERLRAECTTEIFMRRLIDLVGNCTRCRHKIEEYVNCNKWKNDPNFKRLSL